MKYMTSCGQQGIFIPRDEFNKGLWLNEEQKLELQSRIIQNDKLIHELQEDLTILKQEDSNE